MVFFSPMEAYAVTPLMGPLTDAGLYLTFAAFFSLVLTLVLQRRALIVPSNWALAMETYHLTVYGMVKAYIGRPYYFPFILTLFSFLLFSNLFGLFPYASTPTTHLILTFNLSVLLLITSFLTGLLRYKWVLLGLFLPAGTPLALVPMIVFVEILAYITRVSSLGIRITVNMVTGHTLVKVLGGFVWEAFVQGVSMFILLLPLALLSIFLALEILIAFLQAYIFTFITCITVKDSL